MNATPRNRNRTWSGPGGGVGGPGGRTVVVLVVGSILIGYVAGIAAAVTTTIDFEDFDAGTELTGQYKDRGVVFEPQEGQTAGAIVVRCAPGERGCTSAPSGEYAVVTPVDFVITRVNFQFVRVPLVLTFADPQQAVSLRIRETELVQGTFRALLIARDDRGAVVGRDASLFEADTGWHSLSVEAESATIARVEVTLANSTERTPRNHFVVDDLSFGANVAPTPDFVYDPSSPSTANTVRFTDASSDPEGEIAAWRWTFGDGNGSTSRNPTHSYADDGVYTVTLTVTDIDGASARVEQTITVSNVAPTASFDPDCSGDTCAFDATGASDPDGFIRYYAWDFGDGTVANGTAPVVDHAYDAGGTYDVTLTVVDDDGTTASISRQVTAVPTNGMMASFSVECTGLECRFDASSSSHPDGTIRYYAWDFGDGTVANGTAPRIDHAYDAGGTYDVTLTVVDDDGLRSETERTISPQFVSPDPLPLAVTAGVATLLVLGYAALSGALGALAGAISTSRPARGGARRLADEEGAGEETNEDDREDDRGSGPIRVDRIGVRESDDEDLNQEYVSLRNVGDEPFDFGGATVADGHGNTYTVPPGIVLDPGETVTLYTGDGTDRAGELYWGADEGVWDRTTDSVIVRDADGNVLDEGYYT